MHIYIYIMETSCWVCMTTRRFPGLGSPHSLLQSIILKPGEVHERFSSERFIKRDPVIQSCPLRSSTKSPIGITGATDMQRALCHGLHTHIYIYNNNDNNIINNNNDNTDNNNNDNNNDNDNNNIINNNNIHMHIFGSIRILRVYAHISNRCICAHVRSCSGGSAARIV